MKNKTKFIVCFLISFISMTYLISSSMASQKRLINFQGRLTDQQGNPLDGTYDIIFSIYTSATDMDPIWTEEHTNVSISKGLVNMLLGSITSFNAPNKITFDDSRYLGITIDCDHNPHTEEPEMLPRQQILPAIYAYNADRLDGKDSSEYTTPQTDAGRIGVLDKLYEGETPLEAKYVKKTDMNYSCPSGNYIQSINPVGTVECKPDIDTDTDTHLSKSTVQSWANEVDDIGRCTTEFSAYTSDITCPSGYILKSRWFVGCCGGGYTYYVAPDGSHHSGGWVALCCTH